MHKIYPETEEQRTREFREKVFKDLTPDQRYATRLALAKDDFRRRVGNNIVEALIEKLRDSA